ncbi:NACHT domain-containing protein [Rhodohalobacter halophilus]|uniref:NACHT domain-containing protein n=1 Tax=Rhodohalobacter halophilus TaxID=1812810 RepID=UPI00083F8E4B|nr:hypothetical protein [Rhodohalobacter halophilus]
MTDTIEIQVFVSNPGDVEPEKRVVESVCKRLSESYQDYCKVRLRVREWSTIVGQFGKRPQQIINDEIQNYDIYLGIWWMRFGSKTGVINPETKEEFESGTHEEFYLAYENWDQFRQPEIFLFFKEPKISGASRETEQLLKVQKFRENQQKNGWCNRFQDEKEFQSKVYDLLNNKLLNFCFKEKKAKKDRVEKNSKHLPFTKKQDIYLKQLYISRDIIPYNSLVNEPKFRLNDKKNRSRLLEKILIESKIVLLGEAGSGKTTELKKLAIDLNDEDSSFFPIYQQLTNYTPEIGLEDFLPEYWKEIPEDLLVIIWDGLDEIPPEEFNKVVRQINSFSERYSEIRIVISCRTNFYELPNNTSQGTLPDYESYFINDFDIDDVKRFYKTSFEEKEVDDFIANIFENDLGDLIVNPFFVMVLADVYSKNKTLSLSQADLFQQFLFQRMEFDEEHFKTTFEIRSKKQELIELLEKVALGMETLAQNYIQEEDLLTLVNSKEYKMLQFGSSFTKRKGDDRVWKFEHNNIQEYLAARVLSKLEYDKVIQFITFEPDHEKLIPSWLNTLSFLFSLLNSDENLFNQLLKWLLDNEEEVVVKFERDKIPTGTRNELFQGIFNHYKSHDVRINSNKFSDRELAKFGQSSENLKFLISEIKDENSSRINKLNAIHLIGYYNFEDFGTEEISLTKDLLVAEVLSHIDDSYYIFNSIHALEHGKLYDRDVIEKIMDQFGKRENQYIRAAIYSLLIESGYVDNYVDYLVEGSKLLYKQDSNERGQTSLLDESWNLKNCFKSIKSYEGLTTLYQEISKERYFDFGYDSEKILKAIIDNSIQLYKKDTRIFEKFLDWYVKQVNNFRWKWLKEQLRFFKETDTTVKAFQSLWESEDRDSEAIVTALAHLATENSLKFVIKKYEKHDCTNRDIENLYQRMYRVGNESYPVFKELIKENTSISIEEPEPQFDYEKFRNEKRQKDFDLLFEEEGIERSVEQIFQKEEKNVLSEDDLFEMRKIQNRYTEIDDIYPEPALRLLRSLSRKEKNITQREALNWFEENHNVEWYKISLVYEYLSRDENLDVKEYQREWIKNWCDDKISEVDFKVAIRQKEGEGVSSNYIAIYLWYFLRRFDFDYPEHVMLDMLSFDHIEGHGWIGINYITSKLDVEIIKKRVIQNLQDGIEVTQVLLNHIEYAVEHKLKEVYPIIFKEILNNQHDDYDRRKMLNIYYEATKDISELKNLLAKADSLIRWEIVEKLYQSEDFNYLKGYLIEFLSGEFEDEEKLKAAEFLVKMNSLEGLKYYSRWLIDNNPSEYDFTKTNCLNKLTDRRAIPYLLELLELSYDIKVGFERINSLKNNALDALTKIALEDKDNFSEVIERLRDFMEEHKETKNVKFLLHTIERMEHQFYMNKAQSYSINQVKQKLKLIESYN